MFPTFYTVTEFTIIGVELVKLHKCVKTIPKALLKHVWKSEKYYIRNFHRNTNGSAEAQSLY